MYSFNTGVITVVVMCKWRHTHRLIRGQRGVVANAVVDRQAHGECDSLLDLGTLLAAKDQRRFLEQPHTE
jgi:hypothetical protein